MTYTFKRDVLLDPTHDKKTIRFLFGLYFLEGKGDNLAVGMTPVHALVFGPDNNHYTDAQKLEMTRQLLISVGTNQFAVS